MQDLIHQYERPGEEMDTSPGDLMSNKEYHDQTQLIKVAFQNRSESILKLKGSMISLTGQPGSSKYVRCRHSHQVLGGFRNNDQDTDVT